MELVLQHPTFQEDPLATIREHLQNTFQSSNGSSSSSIITNKKANTSTVTTTKSDEMTTIRKRKKNHKFRATRTKRK